MKIVNTALNQAEKIHLSLNQLINTFGLLSMDDRMKETNGLYGLINEFFDNQTTIVEAVYKTKPEVQGEFEAFEQIHHQLLDVYEHLIMRHVDETDFKILLIEFRDLFSQYTGQKYESFMCQIQTYFSDHDEEALFQTLKSRSEKTPETV